MKEIEKVDIEVDLIRRVHEDLKTLTPQAQQRVLDYLRSKLSSDSLKASEAKAHEVPTYPPGMRQGIDVTRTSGGGGTGTFKG